VGRSEGLPSISGDTGGDRAHGSKQGAWRPRPRARVRPSGISPNTWRVPKWARWVVVLGHFWAKFGLGRNSKVGAHIELYNFH
jgi:hypothetical protein